jgi:hypothetical protein
MITSELVAAIDAEIYRLQKVRGLLTLMAFSQVTEPHRTSKKKRTLSEAGRARIIAAQKKRWAEWKETTDDATGIRN